jgi:simple sugar transport system substrate-binding protein
VSAVPKYTVGLLILLVILSIISIALVVTLPRGPAGVVTVTQYIPTPTLSIVTVTAPGAPGATVTVTAPTTVTQTVTAPGATVTVERTVTVAGVAPGKGLTFRIITHGGVDPFWSVVKKGVDDAATLLGVTAIVDLTGGDIALMRTRLEEAIAAGVDGIAIAIADPTAFNDLIEKALAKGIPVVAINTYWPPNTTHPDIPYIGASLYEGGYLIAKYVIAKAGLKRGDHVVIPAEIPGATYAVLRSQGIIAALKEHGMTWEILDAGYEVSTIDQRLTSYLQAHPETKAIICVGGLTTSRSGIVVERLGYKPGQIAIGGFDLLPDTIAYIKKGYVLGVLDQQQYLQGYLAVYYLYLMKKYNFRLPSFDTGLAIVDISNVELVESLVKAGYR